MSEQCSVGVGFRTLRCRKVCGGAFLDFVSVFYIFCSFFFHSRVATRYVMVVSFYHLISFASSAPVEHLFSKG